MFDRIAGLALGYEDLNDHDLLRHDPVLGLLAGKLKGGRKDCAALAGKSTLNRLEHAPEGGEPGRYHFFHGYHGHYCFLPLYVFRGAHPLCAVLRPGNADPALGAVRQLRRILGQFRRRWPDVELIVRADSAYAREEIMAFREGERDIHYVLGVARNDRLAGRIAPELLAAKVESEGRGRPVRLYTEFDHGTRTSWSRARRLIAKAEHIPGKPNPRFLVTSLPETISPRTVYERIYRPRGNAENAIKEQQLDIFADRTSAAPIAANQLRLLFSAFASVLMIRLRAAPSHTPASPAPPPAPCASSSSGSAPASPSPSAASPSPWTLTTPSRPSSPAPAHGSPRSTPPPPGLRTRRPAPGRGTGVSPPQGSASTALETRSERPAKRPPTIPARQSRPLSGQLCPDRLRRPASGKRVRNPGASRPWQKRAAGHGI